MHPTASPGISYLLPSAALLNNNIFLAMSHLKDQTNLQNPALNPTSSFRYSRSVFLPFSTNAATPAFLLSTLTHCFGICPHSVSETHRPRSSPETAFAPFLQWLLYPLDADGTGLLELFLSLLPVTLISLAQPGTLLGDRLELHFPQCIAVAVNSSFRGLSHSRA